MTTVDKGTSHELRIESTFKTIFNEKEFDVSQSKGSGNQRHDGDIQVKAKKGPYKNLMYVECKNFSSLSVPSIDQIHKARQQASQLGYYTSCTILNNKNGEDIVSMTMEDFKFLLELAAKAAPAIDPKKPTMESIREKMRS